MDRDDEILDVELDEEEFVPPARRIAELLWEKHDDAAAEVYAETVGVADDEAKRRIRHLARRTRGRRRTRGERVFETWRLIRGALLGSLVGLGWLLNGGGMQAGVIAVLGGLVGFGLSVRPPHRSQATRSWIDPETGLLVETTAASPRDRVRDPVNPGQQQFEDEIVRNHLEISFRSGW